MKENGSRKKGEKVHIVWRKRSRNIYQIIFAVLAEHKADQLPEYLYVGSMRIGLNRKRVPLRTPDTHSNNIR